MKNTRQPPVTPPTSEANVMVLKFADSKIPQFKEVKNKGYISFGEDNDYPQYLIYLYNKSSKHNAIINGKVHYIFGKGLKFENGVYPTFYVRANRDGETLNDIVMKCLTDIELFGGCYIKECKNDLGKVVEIYHMPFQNIRKTPDGNYAYRIDWEEKYKRTDPVIYKPSGTEAPETIFCYTEYRAGGNEYPLPSYMGSINYIETDIRISQYHLSAISNGMFPSKMIQFFSGEPTEEGKQKIEKKFKDKFAGAEKAGSLVLVFNQNREEALDVTDLSATELDKQFTILNETVQQEIFSGHSITTPALFGISTAGKLGETNNLQQGFEIFKNTYVKVKQERFMAAINYMLTKIEGKAIEGELKPVDPIGFTLSETGLLQLAANDGAVKRWLMDKAGIEIEALPGAQQQPDNSQMANDNLKNLTGRQMANIMRIARKYGKGELTHQQALLLLKNGYQLTEQEAETMLSGGEDV